MGFVKGFFNKDRANAEAFTPTAEIPRSNTQAAIEYVEGVATGDIEPGSPAPNDAQYLVSSANGSLTNERVATNGTGITWDFTGTGTAVANLDFLGFEDLTDPGADRISFWDDSEGAFKWLEASGGIGISATSLTITDADLAGIRDTSFARGDLVVHNGTALTRLEPGAAGKYLRSDGAGNDLIWANISGGGDVTANSVWGFDNRLIRSDDTGKGVQASGITVDDSDNITGVTALSVGDDAYAAGWNGSTNVPTKNAVYDKIELILGTTLPATYQPLDGDLTSWAGVTRASGFDTFTATPSVANLMALLTDDASGLGTFLVTPSSANLKALLTDETGSGAAVFADTPTLVTPILGAATGTSLALSSGTGLTVGASVPFSDAAGVLTLQNVDALDATTEATIEAAIDTLANLGSIQGVAFTFGSYAATLLNNTSEATFKAAVNLEIGVDVQAYSANLAEWSGINPSADGASLVSAANYAAMRALLDLEAGTDFLSPAAIAAAYQPLDADLTAWAGVNPSSYSTTAQIAAAYQPLDGDLTAVAALTTTAAGRSVLTIADPNADRIIAWDDTAGGMAAIALTDLTDEAAPAAGDYVLIYGAEGDLRRANWSTLPGGSGSANQALSNLASVAINTTLVSDADNTDDLGTSSAWWRTLYAKTSIEVGATDTTITRASAGDLAVEGNRIFRVGGADVPLADGGTGASLTDPNADRILFWDDSGGAVTWLQATTGLEISSTDVRMTANQRTGCITYVIDGGGATITTGVKGDFRVPAACTITGVTALADQSGSIVVDIWKDTYANYPPTDSPDSITASAPVTISATTKSEDTTLTGWTTSIAAGDVLRFNVDSVTSIQRLTIEIRVTKT